MGMWKQVPVRKTINKQPVMVDKHTDQCCFRYLWSGANHEKSLLMIWWCIILYEIWLLIIQHEEGTRHIHGYILRIPDMRETTQNIFQLSWANQLWCHQGPSWRITRYIAMCEFYYMLLLLLIIIGTLCYKVATMEWNSNFIGNLQASITTWLCKVCQISERRRFTCAPQRCTKIATLVSPW